MLLVVYYLIFTFIIGLYLFDQSQKNRNLKKIPDIKGLNSLPLFGTALHILVNRRKWINLMLNHDVDSTPVKMKLLNPLVLICRPDDLQIVLASSKCMGKNYFYDLITDYMGEGLLTAPVFKWKKNRKIVQSSFSQVLLNQFVEVFAKKSIEFNEEIAKFEGKTFDLYFQFFKYGADVIFETTMGIPIDSEIETTKLCNYLIRARDIMMEKVANIFLYFKPIFRFTSLYKEEKIILNYASKLVEERIAKKREKYVIELKDNMDLDSAKNKILIENLLQTQEFSNKISDLELLDEIKTFLVAGSETSSSTASFVLIMMALHPEIQDKVYEEAMDVLGPTRSVVYTDIDKFVYLDKVIKETMRLFPIGTFIARKVEEDVKLTTCTIPKGCDILLGIFTLMRSEKYFPDPLTFNPERFTLEEIKKRVPYSYLPFSAGPRNCIGRHYAMMSLKTIIPMCVREFRFETDYKSIEDIELDVTVLIKVVKGYPIKAIRRN